MSLLLRGLTPDGFIGPIDDPWRPIKEEKPLFNCISVGTFGPSEVIFRDDFQRLITHEGLPVYWWRELAVDTDKAFWMKNDKVVWMKNEKIIHVTTRKAWERTMKFRRDFLAERGQIDHLQQLGYDVVLGPFERPQRRYDRHSWCHYVPPQIILAPVVDPDTWKKYPTKIPKPTSGTTRQYENWRVRSDRNLWDRLRAQRWLRRTNDADIDLPLKVSALEFLGFSTSPRNPLFEEFGGPSPASWFIDEMKAGRPRTTYRELTQTTSCVVPRRRRRRREPWILDTRSSPARESGRGRSSSPAREPAGPAHDNWWLD